MRNERCETQQKLSSTGPPDVTPLMVKGSNRESRPIASHPPARPLSLPLFPQHSIPGVRSRRDEHRDVGVRSRNAAKGIEKRRARLNSGKEHEGQKMRSCNFASLTFHLGRRRRSETAQRLLLQ